MKSVKIRNITICIIIIAIICTVLFIVLDKTKPQTEICEICGKEYTVEIEETCDTEDCNDCEVENCETDECNTENCIVHDNAECETGKCNISTDNLDCCCCCTDPTEPQETNTENYICTSINDCIHLNNNGRNICKECLYELAHPIPVVDELVIVENKYYTSAQEGITFDIGDCSINDLTDNVNCNVNTDEEVVSIEIPKIYTESKSTDYLTLKPESLRKSDNNLIFNVNITNNTQEDITIAQNILLTVNNINVNYSTKFNSAFGASQSQLIRFEINLDNLKYAGINSIQSIGIHNINVTETLSGKLLETSNVEFDTDSSDDKTIEICGTLIGQYFELDEQNHPTELIQVICNEIDSYEGFLVLKLAAINDSKYSLFVNTSNIKVDTINGSAQDMYAEQYTSAPNSVTIIPIYLYGIKSSECTGIEFEYTIRDEFSTVNLNNNISVNVDK